MIFFDKLSSILLKSSKQLTIEEIKELNRLIKQILDINVSKKSSKKIKKRRCINYDH